MSPLKATLCACKSKHWIPAAHLTERIEALKAAGYTVDVVDDLCRTAMETPADLQGIANTLVVACHPRAVTNLFRWRGVEVSQVENLRSHPTQKEPMETAEAAGAGNEGWFPVIDKQRCVECGRCFDFCLFGVYSKVDNRIVVAQPDKCKNNCPACARMCPERAIIFPKYDKSPINGGLEEEETFSAESMEELYNERLRYKLQARRESVSLLKKP